MLKSVSAGGIKMDSSFLTWPSCFIKDGIPFSFTYSGILSMVTQTPKHPFSVVKVHFSD